ncbi:MAG: acyltransferase [Roseburia sp.]|nr:acyltransferase [Roseburia sp.]
MTPKPFHENRYDSIQALRGIASLFVVLEHIRFLNCGAFGVDIFFCISGFMMMFSTHTDSRHFLRKRLLRILPFYYVMTVGTYLLLLWFPGMFAQTTGNPVYLIKSLLFIPFDIGGGVLQPLMRIGWTVNCEMFFYLLFFFSLHISHKYRGLICSGLLLLITAGAGLFPNAPAPFRFYGNPIMLEFILGILSYYFLQYLYGLYLRKGIPFSVSLFAALTAFFCFAGLLITKPHINILGFRRPLVWGLPAMVILVCFFVMGLGIRMPSMLTRVGNMSFSLYLIHYYPVQLLDRLIFHFDACTPFTLFGVLVCLIVSLALAWVCWNIFEKRGKNKNFLHFFVDKSG